MGRTTMNRWAVERYTAAGAWLRDKAERLTGRLPERSAGRDRGQTSIEYLGIVVVVVTIIIVLISNSDIGNHIKNAIENQISKITG